MKNFKDKTTDTFILAIKDTLKKGFHIWVDTGNEITYEELLSVLELKEPLSYEQAKKVYSSLSNDPRIKNNIINRL